MVRSQLAFPRGGRSAQYQNSIVCCFECAKMSARIDNLARAVTEPHVALTGGETVSNSSAV